MNRLTSRCLLLIMAAVLLAGCQGLKSRDRQVLLQDSIRQFGKAVRWSDFDYARDMTSPRGAQEAAPDKAFLSQIKVTAWSAGTPIVNDEVTEAVVPVEISFYHEGSGLIRTFVQSQSWWYEEQSNRWLLDGDVPDFAAALRQAR